MSKVGGGAVQKYFSAFQLSYQNKTCSECQQDVRKSVTEADRQTDRLTERQKDRQKKERLFNFIIKTKVAKNVNRMSES